MAAAVAAAVRPEERVLQLEGLGLAAVLAARAGASQVTCPRQTKSERSVLVQMAARNGSLDKVQATDWPPPLEVHVSRDDADDPPFHTCVVEVTDHKLLTKGMQRTRTTNNNCRLL